MHYAMPLDKCLSVSINRPAAQAYDFLSRPENFPRWAVAQTAQGSVALCFWERNSFGVLDYSVRWACGGTSYVPLRVVANGHGCKLVITLFRWLDMSDEEFADAASRKMQDLLAAKRILEAR